MADNTLLSVSGLDFPPYALRGLSQTYTYIESAKVIRRSINGASHDLSIDAFDKIATTISCTDFRGPAFAKVRVGQQIVVDCAFELSYANPTGPDAEAEVGDSAPHTIVPGSARLKDGFVFYRPRLTMRITDFDFTRDEWAGTTGWQLSAEEI